MSTARRPLYDKVAAGSVSSLSNHEAMQVDHPVRQHLDRLPGLVAPPNESQPTTSALSVNSRATNDKADTLIVGRENGQLRPFQPPCPWARPRYYPWPSTCAGPFTAVILAWNRHARIMMPVSVAAV